MKTKNPATSRPFGMFTRTLAGCLALALPGSLHAQDASEDDEVFLMETFEITGGFAGSLADAAYRKEISPLVVEVLVAEDIGKLPDVSIAESLARLPGISTQRINGRAQIISIRGLNEDFSTATLNGREQVTTSSNRGIEFDQYPSELMAGAMIFKTGDAAVVSQGIAGVVDLRTIRPLSHGRRTIATGAYYEWLEFDALNQGSENDGYRYNLTYIDQFADNTIGLAIGLAYSDRPGQGIQWNAWGYPQVRPPQDPDRPQVIGGAKPFIRSSSLERLGFLTTLEYKPSRNFHTTVDFYYTDFKEEQLLRGIELPLFWSSANLEPGFTVEDGLVTKGVFSNVFGVMRNDIVTRDADIYSLGWNVKFNEIAGWDIEFDLSYSSIEREDQVLETYSGTGSNQTGTPDTLAFEMIGDTGAVFTSALDYTDPNLIVLTGPQGWGGDVVPGGQLGFLKTPTSEDELTQLRMTVTRKAPFLQRYFDTIEMGVNHTMRDKSDAENGFFLAGAGGATEIPLPADRGISDLSFLGIPGQISYDPVAALNSGIYNLIPNPNADTLTQDWQVEEKLTTFYGKAAIRTEIAGMPLTGALGMQFIHADQSSTGAAATGGGAGLIRVDLEGSHDYWDFVPSASFNLQPAEGMYVRLSVARQIARQRMEDMRVGTNFSYNPALATSTDVTESPWGGGGGNVELEPWRANSVDLSVEKYFAGGKGYVAVTGFYKHLLTYTRNDNFLTDFTGFPTNDTVEPALREGFVSRPANKDGGELQGVEATLSIPAELITDVLSGFGFILSGSYTQGHFVESFVTDADGNVTDKVLTDLPGLSNRVYNGTVYFEKWGFSSRLSIRHRSEYLANVNTFGPRGRTFRTVESETVLDAQVGYSFESGPAKGLSIVFQAFNLTNEPLSTFQDGDKRFVVDYQEYGASYSLGLSYKF